MDPLDKLLYDLQTIANLSAGKKISTLKEFITVEDSYFLQGLVRWRYDDSRDKTLAVISNKVHLIIKFAILLCETGGTDAGRRRELTNIYEGLTMSLRGFTHLQYTYNNDAHFLANLGHLVQEINDCAAHIVEAAPYVKA